jgi:hypothetical protein
MLTISAAGGFQPSGPQTGRLEQANTKRQERNTESSSSVRSRGQNRNALIDEESVAGAARVKENLFMRQNLK